MDQSLIYAERYKSNPQMLEQALLGHNPQIDPFTALNALQKIKQSGQMQNAQMAQQAPAAQAQPSIKDSTVAAINQERAEPENYFGTGGIVAFAKGGGSSEDKDLVNLNDDGDDSVEFGDNNLGGDGSGVQQYKNYIMNANDTPDTEEQTRGKVAKEMEEAQKVMGLGDPYGDYRKSIAEQEAGAPQELEQGKGIALLKAAAAMSQGNNFARAAAGAAGEFGGAYGEALKADQASKAHRNEMRFHLADAERKEKLGLYRDAAASVAAGQSAASKSHLFDLQKTQALATLTLNQARLEAAQKKGAGAGSAGAQQLEALTQDNIAKGMNPTKARAAATREILGMQQNKFISTTSGYIGGDQTKGDIEKNKANIAKAAQEETAIKDAEAEVEKSTGFKNLPLLKLKRTDPTAANAEIARIRTEAYRKRNVSHRLPNASTGGGGATPALPSGYNLDK